MLNMNVYTHKKHTYNVNPKFLPHYTLEGQCAKKESKKHKNGSDEVVNLRQGGGLVMQKETFGN